MKKKKQKKKIIPINYNVGSLIVDSRQGSESPTYKIIEIKELFDDDKISMGVQFICQNVDDKKIVIEMPYFYAAPIHHGVIIKNN